jgi:hypothetical protein
MLNFLAITSAKNRAIACLTQRDRIRCHNKEIADFSTEDRVPDLFEGIILNMGDLPSARRTLKSKMSKKPSMQTVPS